jgi:hypothetical protein
MTSHQILVAAIVALVVGGICGAITVTVMGRRGK